MKIKSGGQSGADMGALIFADKYGIENEVNIFHGFKPVRNEKYPTSTKVNYVCNENKLVTYSDKLRCRTKYNVLNSDITLILVNRPIENTIGSLLTYNLCFKYEKCGYICNMTYDDNINLVKKFLNNLIIKPNIINVAGQRELDNQKVVKYLEKILDEFIKR